MEEVLLGESFIYYSFILVDLECDLFQVDLHKYGVPEVIIEDIRAGRL